MLINRVKQGKREREKESQWWNEIELPMNCDEIKIKLFLKCERG